MFKLLSFAALLTLSIAAPASKIAPSLAVSLSGKGSANIFINFVHDNQFLIDSFQGESFQAQSRAERLVQTNAALEEFAAGAQASVLAFLADKDFEVESFWSTNQVYVKNADAELVNSLAAREDVESIEEEGLVHLVTPFVEEELAPAPVPPTAEWGIKMVKAPEAWVYPTLGNSGENVVVANIDTGVRVSHETLNATFIGEFGWFDAHNTKTPTPTDKNGHGTHVLGTIAGANGIGVAPKSKWLACRGLDASGSGSFSHLIKCGEFIACPYNKDGEKNCTKAPHVVCNSWGAGGGLKQFQKVIDLWNTNGIIPVFAIGNAGSQCKTAGSPGDNNNVISSGSTTTTDSISSFSSRGISKMGTMKPEVSAPGQGIKSAGHQTDKSYRTLSGTSMAAPHVAGVVALLQGANSTLTLADIKKHLYAGVDTTTLKNPPNWCGTPAGEFPNNVYGYGRINALKSLESLKGSQKF